MHSMNIDTVFLFESPFATSLYPFSIMHCGWEVRTGPLKYFEQVKNIFPKSRIVYHGREAHLKSFLARVEHDDQKVKKENTLILNSAVLPYDNFFEEIDEKYKKFINEKNISKSALFVHQGTPLAAYIPAEEMINPSEFDKVFFPKLLTDYSRLIPNIEISKPGIINFLWDTLDLVKENIKREFHLFPNMIDLDEIEKSGIYLLNKEKITIGKNTVISPGVVLDASDGEIIIGSNVKIMANAVIVGPCCIGDNSVVKIGAKIYENNAIGEYCKVGGEIENSIIHSYSNKQHEGFLGHSYISEWVNLGADTNTSDLKNTYSNIKVNFHKQQMDTGRMFLGLLCGDHTKSAINTSFTTGTVAGICGIIVADGFLPNYIPSFAWRGTKGCSQYKLEKAVETARIVMSRRNKELLDEEIELLKIEYENSNFK